MNGLILLAIFVIYIIFYRSLPGGYAITVFFTLVRAYFKPRLTNINDEDVLTLRTWFCDIDLYGHMNNGSYNLYCDYGRYAIAIRLFGTRWFNNGACVVGTAHIQYIRSLKLFQKFTLRTSIVAVQGKNVWFRQCFESGGKLCAVATMKMVFLDKHYRSIAGREALEEFCSEGAAKETWNDDKYSVPECPTIGEHYLTLDDDILTSTDTMYKKRDINVQVRSIHKKVQYPVL